MSTGPGGDLTTDATALRVVRGTPTAEELAALIAVLCARPTTNLPLTGYDAWRAQRLTAVRRTGWRR